MNFSIFLIGHYYDLKAAVTLGQRTKYQPYLFFMQHSYRRVSAETSSSPHLDQLNRTRAAREVPEFQPFGERNDIKPTTQFTCQAQISNIKFPNLLIQSSPGQLITS